MDAASFPASNVFYVYVDMVIKIVIVGTYAAKQSAI